MNLGIIGAGTIGNYVCLKATERGHRVGAILRRATMSRNEAAGASRDEAAGAVAIVTSVAKLPPDIEHVIDCAGHEALKTYGADILRRGIDLTTVSLGALADEALHRGLTRAARDGNSRLHLVSGAIGALDCLRAARVGGLTTVTYSGRKPAGSWKGTPAEEAFDLDGLCAPKTIFEGSAREASAAYPKNANVAAAVALAGLGFDGTSVRLIADPRIEENVHEVEARGEFGEFAFRIVGRAVPDNPRTSALAAMSVISSLEQETESIRFY